MLNRRIEMKLVKPPKKPSDTPETSEKASVEDYVQLVRESAKGAAKYVAVGVGCYMLLDTFRQCAIKITPEH
jgi:hypothetical protein